MKQEKKNHITHYRLNQKGSREMKNKKNPAQFKDLILIKVYRLSKMDHINIKYAASSSIYKLYTYPDRQKNI